jgi:hypothetical protein
LGHNEQMARAILGLAAVLLVGCASSRENVPPGDSGAGEGVAFPDGHGAVDLDGPPGIDGLPDGCVPSCAGKACGDDDGCGGFCTDGSCPGGQTCVGGVCKDCSRWSLSPAAKLRGVAVDTDGTIYVAGTASSKVYLAVVGSCGTLLGDTQHLPKDAKSATASSLALLGNSVYVGGTYVAASGSDPQDGYLGSFAKQTLASSWDAPLVGGTGKDEVWDLVPAGGALWLGGTGSFDTAAVTWGVKASTSQAAACGFGLAGAGVGRGVTASGGHVYFTGGTAGKGLVARRADSACSISPCAPCSSSWSVTFQDGTYTTEGRGLLVVGTNAYVAGFSSVTSSDLRAVVFRLDLVSGAVQSSYTWNPTADTEMFMDVATDGTALYVVGMQGFGGSAVQAAVHKLSLPDLGKVWSKLPGDSGAYWSVATTSDGGLLLAGETTTGGILRRCLTSGTCP